MEKSSGTESSHAKSSYAESNVREDEALPHPKTRSGLRGRQHKNELQDPSVEIEARAGFTTEFQAVMREVAKEDDDFDSQKFSSVLVKFSLQLEKMRKLEWKPQLEKLIREMKNCIVFRAVFHSELQCEREKLSIRSNIPASEIQAQQNANSEVIIKCAFDVLHKILDLLSPKDAFKFFVELLYPTSRDRVISLMDYVRMPVLAQNLNAVPTVNLSSLLRLAVAALRKAKCTLSRGERKITAYVNIPYTSETATPTPYVDSFCNFLLNAINTPVPDLPLDEVFNALMSTVEAAPFLTLSMDSNVLGRLIEFATANPPGIPVKLTLSLMGLVVTVEWRDEDLNMTRADFHNFAVCVCDNVISKFIVEVKSNSVAAMNLLETIETADAAIRVLVLCAEQPSKFQPVAMRCFTLISDVLLMESHFEKLWLRPNIESRQSACDTLTEKAVTNLLLGCLLFTKNLIKLFGTLLQGNCENDLCGEVEQFTEVLFELFSKSRLFATSNVTVLSALIDCFSALNESLFETLNDTQRVFCVVNVLSHSRHECDAVRAKAARGMAMFLEFKCLVEEEPQFLLDCLDSICAQFALEGKKKSSQHTRLLNSRLTFSWAASNLVDALAKFYSESAHPSLGWQVYDKIFQLGMHLQKEHPKMRYNANRALGALILWTPVQILENPKLEHHIMTIVHSLSDQLGTGQDFKARWNASHAVGNCLRKKEVWEKFNSVLLETILPAYIRAIKAGDNFKEQIYCLKSLQSLPNHGSYGTYYKELFEVVLQAFNSGSESKVFVPYGIFENYKEEVARTILHFAGMKESIKVRDLQLWRALETVFEANQEILSEVHLLISESNKAENDTESIKAGLETLEKTFKDIQM